MTGDQTVFEDQPDFIDCGHDRDLSIRILRGHGVAVVVEANQRQRTGFCLLHTSPFECLLSSLLKNCLADKYCTLVVGLPVDLLSRQRSAVSFQLLKTDESSFFAADR